MQFDDTSLAILDRKRARIASAAGSGDLNRLRDCLYEVPRLLQWIWSQPILRSYVREIIAIHERDEATFLTTVEGAVDELLASIAPLEMLPFVIEQNEDPDAPESADRIAHIAKNARATTDRGLRVSCLYDLAEAIRIRAMATSANAMNANRYQEVQEATGQADAMGRRYAFIVRERQLRRVVSPHTALERLVETCRALNPPVKGASDWTDFFPHISKNRIFKLSQEMKQQDAIGAIVLKANGALDSLVDELHSMGKTALSYRALIGRFKDRCVLYDKGRMQDIANAQRPGTKIDAEREDRLTLELAKYLHDAGVYVLARARFGTLIPDAIGLAGLAIEAKAYNKSGNPKADITGAYAQLHAYMTGLENGPFAPTEGFVVTFRLDGPIYTLPDTIEMGHHRIHSFLIDLGDAGDSGRYQSAPIPISEEEILTAIKKPKAPKKATAKSQPGR